MVSKVLHCLNEAARRRIIQFATADAKRSLSSTTSVTGRSMQTRKMRFLANVDAHRRRKKQGETRDGTV